MYLFESKPQFDKDTGQPAEPTLVQVGLVCDYCGNLIGEGEWGRRLECVYEIGEVGGAEPQFHEERFEVNGQNVDLYELYNQHPRFHYCQDWATEEFCDQRLMIEWMATLLCSQRCHDPVNAKLYGDQVKEFLESQGLGEMFSGRYAHRMILANAMYLARHRAIQKMVKTYTPEQLKLVLDEID